MYSEINDRILCSSSACEMNSISSFLVINDAISVGSRSGIIINLMFPTKLTSSIFLLSELFSVSDMESNFPIKYMINFFSIVCVESMSNAIVTSVILLIHKMIVFEYWNAVCNANAALYSDLIKIDVWTNAFDDA